MLSKKENLLRIYHSLANEHEHPPSVNVPVGQGPDLSLNRAVSELWKDLVALADQWLGLITVQVRLAGISISLMLALAICGAVVGVGAWVTLMAAAALWTVNQGVRWEVVLLGLSGINAILAASTVVLVGRLSRNLLLEPTRRQLTHYVKPTTADGA